MVDVSIKIRCILVALLLELYVLRRPLNDDPATFHGWSVRRSDCILYRTVTPRIPQLCGIVVPEVDSTYVETT
eukprot:scaffold332047_cov35-Attheya_sp.AAC.1